MATTTPESKRKHRTTNFLIGSFLLLLIISISAFAGLGRYMGQISRTAIHKVGDLYMSGINEHIIARFNMLITLKIEQADALVEVVPADAGSTEEVWEELVYRATVRNFLHLALCAEDGTLEMLSGDQLYLADPDPFFESLRRKEKKVAIGSDAFGERMVLFGTEADYPMKSGKKCMALVAALPVDYVSSMLSSDEENALIYSHIIRRDGSFIVSSLQSQYSDYFASLYDRYSSDPVQDVDDLVAQLSNAMNQGQPCSVIAFLDGSTQQVYSTPLPYSEWHLITILPSGVLTETVEDLNRNRTEATMLVCAVILVLLLAIFCFYFHLTRQHMRELDQARQEALAATKAKSTFLSNMSHDIRTPMNAIVGMTAIAISHIDDKEQVQNCLRRITLSGRHLLGLINDVLDMSRIESGKMALNMEQISLREVLESVVGIVQTQAKAKEQSFMVRIDSIIAEEVLCDSVRLSQVLLNILSNAVKYTPQGGSIQLTLLQENAPEEKGPNYVRNHIFVKDTGIGMTAEFLTRIFNSYSRADSKRVQQTEGAGLGMAITKWIVDALDGSIDIKSEPGKGTEFHVTLDLEKGVSKEVDMVLPPWRMLVVDDDKDLCRTAVETLKSIGVQADWTLSGEEAVELVAKQHRAGNSYQIILLDWKLPGMDGLATARQIRKIAEAEMPIILISAYDWSDFETEAREAGINGFIVKPLFKSTLFYSLRKYMGGDAVPENEGVQDVGMTGRRILVAEDNDLNWEILYDLLSDMGMELEWAQNGKVCVEKFQDSQPGYYDAILMDIRMPVMDGYEATRAIRAIDRPDAQTLPIIAMTADAFSEDVQKCLESGMNAHTAKPVNLSELVGLLKKFIANDPSEPAGQ